ncbi:MAG: D-aminoacylase [Verrucomicrobia bacterium]|nr:D-aminoacylase [Verrucomicrobiota bacterium]
MNAIHAFTALLIATLSVAAADYDFVLRNGRIVDGSGKPAIAGDLAIKDGRIAAVGKVSGIGASELDARGKVVAPGFIDVHTHSEDILKHRDAENFLRMGVTTVVTGNCGGSRTDITKFFAELEATNVTLNVASLIGHNSIRTKAMGGSFDRPPTADELARMKAMVEQAMKEGAVGLSTGLIYLPGTFTKTDEIVELAKVAAAHGGLYVSHIRHETERIFEALDELCRVAREAKVRSQISHIKLAGPKAWNKADAVLAVLDKARAEGLDIAHDQYVYTASSTGLSRLVPDKAREGGTKKFIERIGDPEQKRLIVAEMKETLKRSLRSDYGYVFIANCRHDNALSGKTVPQAAKLRHGSDSLNDQIELVLDLERHGGATAIFHGMNEPDVRCFLRHPFTMVASDGGPRAPSDELTHPRSCGNNARVLGRYVRELKLLTIEEAVRKMTSLPARAFRLDRRGELKPGCAADVVVFDPTQVADRATFEKPRAYAVGFSDVFVNGTAVIRNGSLTGARPGKPIRLSSILR